MAQSASDSFEVISQAVAHPLFSNPYLQALPRDHTHVEASCQTSRPGYGELLRRKRFSLGCYPREESPPQSISVINLGFDSATCITQRTFDGEDNSVSFRDWGRKILHAHVKNLNKDWEGRESAQSRKGCLGFVKFRWVDQAKLLKSRQTDSHAKEAKPRAPSASNLPKALLRPSFSQDFHPTVFRPKSASISSHLRAKLARRKQSLDQHPSVSALGKAKDSQEKQPSKAPLSVFDVRDISQWTSQKRQVWK